MKKSSLVHVATFLMTAGVFAQSHTSFTKQKVNAIAFTENKGQVHDQNYQPRTDILYGVMAGNMAVHIKKTGVSYQLYRVDTYKETEDFKTKEKRKEIDQQTIYRIDLTWLNANTSFTKTEDEALAGYSNYYLENCLDGALNVKSYKGITLHNLYKGIDLHYYEKNGELKHDYIVAPHANCKQIQLKVEGAEISVNEDGSLILSTPLGKVQEGTPIVYQQGKQLKAKWILKKNILSFEIENYNSNYELIIDPVTRLWGTYYGGSNEEKGLMTSADAFGNVYIGGTTASTAGTVIATTGSHQSTLSGGVNDGFLAKFNNTGLRLWSTYYGGSANEEINACSVDVSGNVYAAGASASSSGIASGGHQMSNNGGGDAFLVKFDANGIRQWGTYYGSGSSELIYGCATDASGNVYISGSTGGGSGTVIVTSGAHQTTYGGGSTDGFLVKFNSSGIRQWGTYYGGSTGNEVAFACAVDIGGNVYLAGYSGTNTSTIIASSTGHQSSYGGGSYDAYLAKFNSSGVRQWATYYGGASSDFSQACTTDINGDIYLAGTTASATGTIIATSSGQQNTYGGGPQDCFLAKFNTNGVRLWSTYYGGSANDGATSISCDANGNVFMVGISASPSSTNIATPGSHQPTNAGGTHDAYLAKFDGNGVRQWGTYYGGTGEDLAYSCSADLFGSVYIYGYTSSSSGTGIASLGSHQSAYGGGTYDAFLARFDVCDLAPTQPSAISGPVSICSGVSASYSIQFTPSATSYAWSLPVGWTGAANNNTISATPGSTGVFTVTAGNSCGTSPQRTLSVNVLSSPTVSVGGGTICNGESFTLTPSGANTYIYSSGPIVTPGTTTSYSVTGTGSNGCVSSNTAIATINVNPLPIVTASTNMSVLCVGEQATLTAGGAISYTFNPGGAGASISISPSVTTSYSLTGANSNGCKNTAVVTQSVDACTGILTNKTVLNGIKLFPNPVSNVLNIDLKNSQQIEIINAIGQIVYSDYMSQGNNAINIENLSTGLYIVKAHGGAVSVMAKFIKE